MHLRLQNFDGPLDLLLFLIKSQEINIFNIPVAIVTEQYLGYLRRAVDLDFAQAGEYVAMAAQLIEIKASLLLPTVQQIGLENPEELAEDDPRKPLVEQLLQYEAIRSACVELNGFQIWGRDVFGSGEWKRREEEFEELSRPLKGDPFSLVIALEAVLLKFADRKKPPKVTVRAQTIGIQERMNHVRQVFAHVTEANLMDIFCDCSSRYELIVTFMAILELAKSQHILIIQLESLGTVTLSRGPRFGDVVPVVDENHAQNESVPGAGEALRGEQHSE